jgi:hypothetical protein
MLSKQLEQSMELREVNCLNENKLFNVSPKRFSPRMMKGTQEEMFCMVPGTQNILSECQLLYYLFEPCFCSMCSSLSFKNYIYLCGESMPNIYI